MKSFACSLLASVEMATSSGVLALSFSPAGFGATVVVGVSPLLLGCDGFCRACHPVDLDGVRVLLEDVKQTKRET